MHGDDLAQTHKYTLNKSSSIQNHHKCRRCSQLFSLYSLIFIAVCHFQHKFKVLMVNRLCFHSNINSDVTFCTLPWTTTATQQRQHTHFHITESIIFNSSALFACSVLLCFVVSKMRHCCTARSKCRTIHALLQDEHRMKWRKKRELLFYSLEIATVQACVFVASFYTISNRCCEVFCAERSIESAQETASPFRSYCSSVWNDGNRCACDWNPLLRFRKSNACTHKCTLWLAVVHSSITGQIVLKCFARAHISDQDSQLR